MHSIGQNLKPFTGIGDISIRMKNSGVGSKSQNKQANKHTMNQINQSNQSIHPSCDLLGTPSAYLWRFPSLWVCRQGTGSVH